MAKAVRKNDTESGTCYESGSSYSRTGVLNQSYSSDVFTNGRQAVRKSDKGTIDSSVHQGSNFSIVSASSNVYINGMKAVKLDDSTECDVCGGSGGFTSGSGNVYIN